MARNAMGPGAVPSGGELSGQFTVDPAIALTPIDAVPIALDMSDLTPRPTEAELLQLAIGDVEASRRRDAERAEQIAVLLRVIPSGIIIVDHHQTVIAVNDVVTRQFPGDGSELSSWVGLSDEEAQTRISRSMAEPADFLARASALTAAHHMLTEDVQALDGRVFERDYIPISDESGGSVDRGHVWMFWDFTDRRAVAEREIRLLRAELTAQQLGVHALGGRAREAERAERVLAHDYELLQTIDGVRKQLLATASHELRTPLTSILSFTQLFEAETATADDRAQFVGVIERNAKRLLRLVDDLLLLARLGSASHPLERELADLSALVFQSVHELRAVAAGKGVDIVETVVDPLWADIDPSRITQVVNNVVGNAVKYSGSGTTVEVALTRTESSAVLVVSDRGIGIPPEDLPNVFEQFFRASSARSAGIAGTGLGLALVKSIVDLHHGDITVTARAGSGTVVTVTLPLADPDE